MNIDILTIFPQMFSAVIDESMIKRAQQKKIVSIRTHDIRDYTLDKHRKVDDRPFGGGSGMVLSVEPIFRALARIRARRRQRTEKVILLSAQGKPFDQACARRLAGQKRLVLICGHYEGVDERVAEHLVDEEISIGDYVLTGGELAAMVVIDAVVRLLPGVLGDKNSLNFESFEGNLLEYPHYTRPAVFRGWQVPAVLLGGDHTRIAAWRKQEAFKRTKARRPDLSSTHTKERKHG